LAKEIYFLQNAEGSGLAPFDCWLCLRGIKTMSLRVEKQQVLFQSLFQVPLVSCLVSLDMYNFVQIRFSEAQMKESCLPSTLPRNS
jgi:hypothetical protein